jgi:hypothetical protein
MSLKAALANRIHHGGQCRLLEDVLDGRIGELTELVELQLRRVPPDVFALPTLRGLGLTGKEQGPDQ